MISMVLILSSFYLLNKNLELQQYKYMQNRISYFNHKSIIDIEDELENLGYVFVQNSENILKNSKILYSFKQGKKDIKYLKNAKKFYIYFVAPNRDFLLLDKKFITYNKRIFYIIFGVIMTVFISLYIIVIKKLIPLKKLLLHVKSLADEKFDVSLDIKGDDEIALLAKEFEKSVKRLKELKLSRDIFVKNIMHELKTPITKGKLLLELPLDDDTKEQLQKVFYRLQNLLNEFLQIENFLSIKQKLNKKSYILDDLVDSAIDISLYDESLVVKKYENIRLNVDFKLFIIALKNLIDNGIKYSKDKKVTITNSKNSIKISNNATALNYPLEKYFEPSFDENSNKLSLGIYITNYILKDNLYRLSYEHVEGKNIFMIVPCTGC
jgi:two-component system OmpR family sensor kinase